MFAGLAMNYIESTNAGTQSRFSISCSSLAEEEIPMGFPRDFPLHGLQCPDGDVGIGLSWESASGGEFA